MFAALIKAAIFYFVFLQLRKLLKSNGVFENKASRNHHVPPRQESYQGPSRSHNDDDVIEADYRVID